jgi:hypothetical protein
MIPFTRRELHNAWRSAKAASIVQPRTNPHRLLLFYAAECGLKAVYLKQQQADIIDGDIADKLKHDLNKIMDLLRMGKDYLLPISLSLPAIKQKDGTERQRPCDAGTLNQVWRYGGSLKNPSDAAIEQQLEKINLWIAEELR